MFKLLLFLLLIFFKISFAMIPSISTPVITEEDSKKVMPGSISLPIITDGPNYIPKTSQDSIYNRSLNNEYVVFENIYKAFYDYANKINTTLKEVIVIPEPTYEEISQESSIKFTITIQKLFPIDKYEKNLTKIYLSENSYNQLKLAQPFGFFMDRTIGYKETKAILKKNRKIFAKSKFKNNFNKLDNIKSLFFNLGCLMAIINYKAQYDGRDCSIFLAKEKEKDKFFKITVSDVDSCRDICKNLNYNSIEAQKKIVTAMLNNPFLPNPNNKYFTFFEQGYLEVAQNLNFKDLAISVIEEFSKSQNN